MGNKITQYTDQETHNNVNLFAQFFWNLLVPVGVVFSALFKHALLAIHN